ncbi:hypothetical protein DFH07DRAFT_821798 [Mycena maculata]|uniref:F-box domain-containing protein n=1 Tax=Mycena maculata TaxID=230809 RepID=A0AAD7J3G7_9AGAR|nr:hypothetical protein DFH07DRAFT_821798 [Mycena maculata]
MRRSPSRWSPLLHFLDTCPCPLHCPDALTEDFDSSDLLKSPYPELLSTNTVPSDSQMPVIRETIQIAETGIARLAPRRCAELEDFARSHRHVVSIVRRLPSEILCEIFGHCRCDEDFSPADNAPWRIARVCGRWRKVALALPALWNHFSFDWWSTFGATTRYATAKYVAMQLLRSGQAPLRICELNPIDQDDEDDSDSSLASMTSNLYLAHWRVFDVLLLASNRWQDVTLFHRKGRFELRGEFPMLKRLTVHDTRPGRNYPINSLPVLEELTLNGPFSAHFIDRIPWSWPRVCTLRQCYLDDALRILSQLPPGARVTIASPLQPVVRRVVRRNPTSSSIRSLTLMAEEPIFPEADLFYYLTAPALEELDLEQVPITLYCMTIVPFLARSACPLTRLRISVALLETDVLGILGSPYMDGLLTLELVRGVELSNHSISELASPTLLPHLRTLAVRCSSAFTEAQLLAMVAARRPILQSLHLESDRSRGEWVPSQNLFRTLRVNGVQVTQTLLSC